MIFCLLGVGWLVCGILAYIIFLHHDKPKYGWTLKDRVCCGGICLIVAPAALVMAIIEYNPFGIDWNKQVKW